MVPADTGGNCHRHQLARTEVFAVLFSQKKQLKTVVTSQKLNAQTFNSPRISGFPFSQKMFQSHFHNRQTIRASSDLQPLVCPCVSGEQQSASDMCPEREHSQQPCHPRRSHSARCEEEQRGALAAGHSDNVLLFTRSAHPGAKRLIRTSSRGAGSQVCVCVCVSSTVSTRG